MLRISCATTALFLTGSTALAGGLDTTGQPMNILFEPGNYLEFGISHFMGEVSGYDLPMTDPVVPGGAPTGDLYEDITMPEAALKFDVNEEISAAIIYNQPWLASNSYRVNTTGPGPNADGSFLLGGTGSEATSHTLTGLARYKFDDNWSVFGGLRIQDFDANLQLHGAAVPELFKNYNMDIEGDIGFGYVVGAAYEIPEIAARVAVSYQSAITHDVDLTETSDEFPGGVTSSTSTKAPQSFNLDLQSAVSPNILLFAGVRWVEFDQLQLTSPETGMLVAPVPNITTYQIGGAYRFNENWAALLGFAYEEDHDNPQYPVLGPVDGLKGVVAGLQYTKDKYKVLGLVRYGVTSEAIATAEDANGQPLPLTQFEDNYYTSFTIKVGRYF